MQSEIQPKTSHLPKESKAFKCPAPCLPTHKSIVAYIKHINSAPENQKPANCLRQNFSRPLQADFQSNIWLQSEKISNFRDEMTVASVTDSPPLSNLESNCAMSSLSYTLACELTPSYPLSYVSSDSDLTSENLDNYSF